MFLHLGIEASKLSEIKIIVMLQGIKEMQISLLMELDF